MGWITHDLSTFIGEDELFGGLSTVQFSDGFLQVLTPGVGGQWRFALPTLLLAASTPTLVEITFASDAYDHFTGVNAYSLLSLASVDPAVEPAITDDFHGLSDDTLAGRSGAVFTSTIGPGLLAFDVDVATRGYRRLMFVIAGVPADPNRIVQIRSNSGGPTHAPPLRQYPRSDGLGASSVRRLWPPPASIQASNRRAGGYL